MRYKRKCYNCNTTYSFCDSCWDFRNEPYWKSTFHSEDCAKIFQCCVDYNMKLISKEEAQDILLDCDLSDKANFRKDVQRTISAILAEPKKAEPAKIEYKKAE